MKIEDIFQLERRCRWIRRTGRPADPLVTELGLGNLAARVLAARGFADPEEAAAFLDPSLDRLHDPFSLSGMTEAVRRLLSALEAGERICVYGDYDVDGITATAITLKVLKRLGALVDYYLPSRQGEGYGLHAEALENLARRGVDLVLTVDCGVSAVAEVANSPVPVIVTDHHRPGDELPPAVAVVNPRSGGGYPFRDLAGVGVAFKLAQALWREVRSDALPEDLLSEGLALAALGTVADVVPLVGENRVLVSQGLARMPQVPSPGLRALAAAAGLEAPRLEARHLAFVLSPRLNAAGRISDPREALELLLTEDEAEARRLAASLEEQNRRRRELEGQVLAQARSEASAQLARGRYTLVVAGEGWHPGVIGIVASRLVDEFSRPAVVISLEGDVARGSARGIAGFDVYEALAACADHLVEFGGHAGAGGMTLVREKVREFADAIEEYARGVLEPGDLVPAVEVDARVDLSDVTLEAVRELEALAPFGYGNPRPVIEIAGVRVVTSRKVGGGEHIRASLADGRGGTLQVVGFGMGDRAHSLARGRVVDVVGYLEVDEWQGRYSVQLSLLDIAGSERTYARMAALLKGLRHDLRGLPPEDAGAVLSLLEGVLTGRNVGVPWKGRGEVTRTVVAMALLARSLEKRLAFFVRRSADALSWHGALTRALREHGLRCGLLLPAGVAAWLDSAPRPEGEVLVAVPAMLREDPAWVILGEAGALGLRGTALVLLSDAGEPSYQLVGEDEPSAAAGEGVPSTGRRGLDVPDRTSLARVFRFLRDRLPGWQSWESLGDRVAAGTGMSRRLAVAHLWVLRELELLECAPSRDGLRVRLVTAKRKRDLMESVSFRQFVLEREHGDKEASLSGGA